MKNMHLNMKPVYDYYQNFSDEDIQELQGWFSIKLSDDFISFFQNYGCSSLTGQASVKSLSVKEYPISVFFGGRGSAYDAFEYLSDYGDEIPPQHLPIACDEFGNLYLLELNDLGRVLYWQHDNTELSLQIIAESFLKFIDAIEHRLI